MRNLGQISLDAGIRAAHGSAAVIFTSSHGILYS
jgi:hypothetical protein